MVIVERFAVSQMRKSKTVVYHAVTSWTLKTECFIGTDKNDVTFPDLLSFLSAVLDVVRPGSASCTLYEQFQLTFLMCKRCKVYVALYIMRILRIP